MYSEMISADGAVRLQQKTLRLASFSEAERPIALQLFGADPETTAEAAKILAELKPDFIDLNFGCPAQKVVKRGAGAALLRDLPLLQRVAAAVVRASAVPVAAKLRSGWDENSINVVEAAQRLQDAGVHMVAVHPRTRSMQFGGHADWRLIAKVKEKVSIPVIGNGDVKTAADVPRMIAETGCDGVMIGRAACGNPWIFHQAREMLRTGVVPPPPSPAERAELCLRHLRLGIEFYGEKHAVLMMRKQLLLYFKGLPGAAEMRKRLLQQTTFEGVQETVNEYARAIDAG